MENQDILFDCDAYWYDFLQCFEDIYIDEKPTLKEVLYYLNIVYAVLFSIEMLMKWVALGFKKYFSSFWTILDFCIVVVGWQLYCCNYIFLTFNLLFLPEFVTNVTNG